MVCFLGFQLRGVSPRITAKRAITAECRLFHQHFNAKTGGSNPPSQRPPLSSALPRSLQANNQPRRMGPALKGLVVPYLAASPQRQDKVLFSQLTGGWCRTHFTTTPACCLYMDAKGHSLSVPPHMRTILITTEGPPELSLGPHLP